MSNGKKYPLNGKKIIELQIGDTLYRHPLPGERCFINR